MMTVLNATHKFLCNLLVNLRNNLPSLSLARNFEHVIIKNQVCLCSSENNIKVNKCTVNNINKLVKLPRLYQLRK